MKRLTPLSREEVLAHLGPKAAAVSDNGERLIVDLDEATGAALEQVMADDRQFFAENPQRSLRIRRPYPVEHWGLDLTDDLPSGCEWYMIVGKLETHVRRRNAFWAAPLTSTGKLQRGGL
jgi:hypothetical protein